MRPQTEKLARYLASAEGPRRYAWSRAFALELHCRFVGPDISPEKLASLRDHWTRRLEKLVPAFEKSKNYREVWENYLAEEEQKYKKYKCSEKTGSKDAAWICRALEKNIAIAREKLNAHAYSVREK